MGTGDQKANLSYVLETTNYETIPYVGHSQGTTQMFYALSVDNWFNERISLFTGLGPVTKPPHADSPMAKIGFEQYDKIQKITWAYDVQHVGGEGMEDPGLCLDHPWLCTQFSRLINNGNPEADDVTRTAVASGHSGGSTPWRSIKHYAQMANEDRFQVWAPRYSSLIGQQRTTELIPLANIDVPVALFVAVDDTLAVDEDVQWTAETIGPKKVIHYQYIEGGHNSFLLGKDMSYWNDVLALFQLYPPQPALDII